MPAVSQAQRGYLASKFGHAWMVDHGFDNPGKLPHRVPKKKKGHGRGDNISKALAGHGR